MSRGFFLSLPFSFLSYRGLSGAFGPECPEECLRKQRCPRKCPTRNPRGLGPWGPECQESPRQTKPKKGPKRKVHEFRPFFVNSGVVPWENKRDSHRSCVPVCPREKFMNWPFFGLVCRGHSWECSKSVPRVSRDIPWDSLGHPRFQRHSRGHSPGNSGLKGSTDPCNWSAGSQQKIIVKLNFSKPCKWLLIAFLFVGLVQSLQF